MPYRSTPGIRRPSGLQKDFTALLVYHEEMEEVASSERGLEEDYFLTEKWPFVVQTVARPTVGGVLTTLLPEDRRLGRPSKSRSSDRAYS